MVLYSFSKNHNIYNKILVRKIEEKEVKHFVNFDSNSKTYLLIHGDFIIFFFFKFHEMFSCISWNMRSLIIFVLINLCLAYNELMTFYLIFAVYNIHCTWLYLLDKGFPLWQCFCVAAKIFVYLGLCNIMFYFDYFIFSFLRCII